METGIEPVALLVAADTAAGVFVDLSSSFYILSKEAFEPQTDVDTESALQGILDSLRAIVAKERKGAK